MRQTQIVFAIVLAIAGGLVSPRSFAQSVQGSVATSTRATAASSHDMTAQTPSKAHRAMASFTSLLREAALQSQAATRASASTQAVAQPARPATDGGDALASTPDPGAIH